MRKVYTILSIFICLHINAQFCLKHINTSTNGDAKNVLSSPKKIISSDFNRDGKADIAVIYDELTSHVTILIGEGTGTFKPEIQLASTDSIYDITSADFNKDGKADIAIVASNNNTNVISIFLGNGDGTFGNRTDITLIPILINQPVIYSIINADFDSDGKVDIAVASKSNGISILLGNGNGTFKDPKSFWANDEFTNSMIVSDFNKDGKIDLATTSLTSDSLLFFLGNGNGTFSSSKNIKLSYNNYSTVVANDFNVDGIIDIVVADMLNIYVYTGTGGGNFNSPISYGLIAANKPSIVCADFNNDGKLDLAEASYYLGLSILFGNGDCTFKPAVNFGTDVSSIVNADINGGGNADLIMINGATVKSTTNNISVYMKDVSFIINLDTSETICPSSLPKILDAGSGFQYLWGDRSTAQTLTVTKGGKYYVTVTNNTGCTYSDSIRITIKTPHIETNAVATVLKNNRIVFAWERTSNQNTSSYKVLRESNSANIYKVIGSRSINQDSYIADSSVNASQQEYKYKLRTYNDCGDSAESPIHKTILLQVNYSTSLKANVLTWYGYLGIPLSTYHIFRNGVEINSIAASATNNTYPMNDYMGSAGDKYYISYDLPDSIYTTKMKYDSGPFSLSLSNMAESELTENGNSKLNDEIQISPIPANNDLNVNYLTENVKHYSIEILNTIGQIVLSKETNNENNQHLNISELFPGFYLIRIKTDKGIITKQIVITR